MGHIKELAGKEGLFTGGHRLCAGCGIPVVVRQFLAVTEHPVIVAAGTGCLQVASAIYPYTAWRTGFIHSAFANTASTISGVEAAYKALKRKGLTDKEFHFIAIAGDGGTYDIGLQALSGMLERGHRVVYICNDNEGYMNTGVQASSATPLGADTTTTPVGARSKGKERERKDIIGIVLAHNVPYVAQVSPAHWHDLTSKAKKALKTEGPSFINSLTPCPRGWRSETHISMELCRLAVDTCYWPLFEVEEGVWRLNYRPRIKRPLADYLRTQARFKHLFLPENKDILENLQASVDRQWEQILKLCDGN